MNLICEKIGEQVTVADVIGMANMVTDFYQQRGYISTIAYLPPQKGSGRQHPYHDYGR